MPFYPYRCHKDKGGCGEKFEITKSVSRIDEPVSCPHCKKEEMGKEFRILGPSQIMGADDWNKAEYNPAFGQVVRNKRHRDELAKRHNMVEVGNEKPEALHKHFDKERADRRKARWDSV